MQLKEIIGFEPMVCKGIPSKIDLYALTNLIQRCLAHGMKCGSTLEALETLGFEYKK